MKIIGAGFGRTGTYSIKFALEELGFDPCYHMKACLTRPWHIPFWLKAEKKSERQWKRFFRNYKATIDWPACEYYTELMKVWPDAKVLLNVRDPEAWYKSSLKTIYGIQYYFPWWFPKIFVKLQKRLIWQGRFKGRFEDKEFAVNNFLQHIEEVKKNVSPEKLLVYDVKEGWEPLCRFLEVPVPEKAFPHLHDTEEYLAYIRRVKKGFALGGISIIILILIVFFCHLIF